MILTVTANTTLDQTLFVPRFIKNGTVRASRNIQSMGGKPTDASWILGRMGIPSLALGFVAGAIGDRVIGLLKEQGVTVSFIEVDGQSRINTLIVDESDGSQTTITTSTLEVSDVHTDALYSRYSEALENATVVILGGTLPSAMSPEFYANCISLARDRHVPVIFDADEPNLGIGVRAGPTLIKPNRDELSRLIGERVESIEDTARAGVEILEKYNVESVVTLGADGAVATLHDKVYYVAPVNTPVVSAAGAGDAILAGLAASIHQGHPIEEGLRLGFATAAAVLLQPGTAVYEVEEMQRIKPQIELQLIN